MKRDASEVIAALRAALAVLRQDDAPPLARAAAVGKAEGAIAHLAALPASAPLDALRVGDRVAVQEASDFYDFGSIGRIVSFEDESAEIAFDFGETWWAPTDKLTKITTPHPASADVVAAPREPTDAMRKAGQECIPYELLPKTGTMDHAYYVYRAMLEAALASGASPPGVQVAQVSDAFAAVLAELERATTKFPTWPTDPLHAVAVLGEEFGELVRAVLQVTYEPHKATPEDVATEAMQTAAMALRFVASLGSYAYARCPQHKQGDAA